MAGAEGKEGAPKGETAMRNTNIPVEFAFFAGSFSAPPAFLSKLPI
jgi:hypothetical protein